MAEVVEKKEETQNFANEIWTVADILHGPFQDDEYGEVILPFSLLRRFECVLQASRQKVLDTSEVLKNAGIRGEQQFKQLCVAAGMPFYNLSKYTLGTIGSTHTKENLIKYKNSFSPNVRELFNHFEFDRICERLEKSGKIYAVVEFFQQLNMNVSARVMSNLYEELIWRFADSKHKASKEFLTPRDIVHLATTLVLDSDKDTLTANKGLIRTIYDPTCGTCGFITDAMEYIRDASHDAPHKTSLLPFGQEVNAAAWSMGKAMMLLHGCEETTSSHIQDISTGIALGDTLKTDLHENDKFDYVFSNPPFGMDWKDSYTDVRRDPRFMRGLPPKSDGSMLFLSHVAQKMNPPEFDEKAELIKCGHAAIVLSGSPLFTGGAGSGSSEIRRWLLEDDLVEAIIQLPNEMFYNTSISTYLWILSSYKPTHKKGKVQLIDASGLKTPIRNIGNKRYVINQQGITKVAEEFRDFKDSEISKILDYKEFGYRSVAVKVPLKVRVVLSSEKIGSLLNSELLGKLGYLEKEALRKKLQEKAQEALDVSWISEFMELIANTGIKIPPAKFASLLSLITDKDPKGQIAKNKKGEVLYDKDQQQIENIPLTKSVDDYFKREVLPFLPDAEIDKEKIDSKDGLPGIVGYEINFNKYFYKYVPPRDPDVIAKEILSLEEETTRLMKELFS